MSDLRRLSYIPEPYVTLDSMDISQYETHHTSCIKVSDLGELFVPGVIRRGHSVVVGFRYAGAE